MVRFPAAEVARVDPMLTDLEVARVCHEVNRAYCESLGDHSHEPWEFAGVLQKASAENGVKAHRDNPFMVPSAIHESWMREKVEAGWVYGEEKDVEAKTHPCIVAFDDLPVEQQSKDFIFRAVVHALS